MERTFDTTSFLKRTGEDLVRAFERARQATTPGLIGSAMEHSVIKRLENVLPRGISIGSGCVIDAAGRASRQMDVVLYERNICPVFSVNNEPETTYYPCEGVIAVGEVKSRLGKPELEDAFRKIESVKSLHRAFSQLTPMVEGHSEYLTRRYGELSSASNPFSDFDPYQHEAGAIFSFALAGELSAKPETMLRHLAQLVSQSSNRALCPSIVVSLTGDTFFAARRSGHHQGSHDRKRSMTSASHVICDESRYPFCILLTWLHDAWRTGRTADAAAFEKYLLPTDGSAVEPCKTLEIPLHHRG